LTHRSTLLVRTLYSDILIDKPRLWKNMLVKCVRFALTFGLAAGLGYAQRGADAATLIAEVASAARSATSWLISGQTTQSLDGRAIRTTGFHSWYLRAPSRARTDTVGSEGVTVAHVCDGSTEWTWYPATRMYTQTASPQSAPCSLSTSEWPTLAADLRTPRLLGTAHVFANGSDHICSLVRGDFQPPVGYAAVRTLCIDPVSKLILRQDTERITPGGRALESIAFATIRRNAPIAGEILEFEPPPDGRAAAGSSNPVGIDMVQPEYAPKPGLAAPAGVVAISLVITAEGFAEDLVVISTAGAELDEKAVAAVKRWQWQPAIKDGRPIASDATVRVNFRASK
jgi:TonB family protein